MVLKIEGLEAFADGRRVLHRLSLRIKSGVHVLLGPNGSGKTSLLSIIAGVSNLSYRGKLEAFGVDIGGLSPAERFKLGIFMAFQFPPNVRGITLETILRKLTNTPPGSPLPWKVREVARRLGITEEMLTRELNKGFSGGERKKAEILQAYFARPRLLLLDEPDSGVDIDSVKVVADLLRDLVRSGTSMLIVTHSTLILRHIEVAKVHVILDGQIICSGGKSLIEKLEGGFKAVEKCRRCPKRLARERI